MEKKTFTRADGSIYVASGYIVGKPTAASKKFAASGKADKLPPKVDLRKYMTAVENQEELGSCTANAVAGAYEYLVKRHKEIEDYDVSRLFIYYNARAADDSVAEDAGSRISAAVESLQEYGACSEETWPYEIASFAEEPDDDSYSEASNFIVEDVQYLPTDLNEWKKALAEGHPIIFALSLFDSFDKQRKPGLVPQPTAKEVSRAEHSGHAMLCVGYSDTDKIFIVRNSWGDDWGDKGYCYMPYDYIMNDKYNYGDSWIIRQLDNFEIDEDTWGDDESITGDYDTFLDDMSDEDYEEMIDAMGDYSLEFRIGVIVFTAAAADGEVSDEEYDAISVYMQDTLDKLGIDMQAKKILKRCAELAPEGDILEESITLVGDYLPSALLGKLLNDIRDIVGTDDVSDEEEEFLGALTQAWQVEGGEEDEEDEDEDEDDDDEDDEDDEDEDEDEEDDEE